MTITMLCSSVKYAFAWILNLCCIFAQPESASCLSLTVVHSKMCVRTEYLMGICQDMQATMVGFTCAARYTHVHDVLSVLS